MALDSNVGNNSLTGTIASEWGMFPSTKQLGILVLSGNQLNGTIPASLGKLNSLNRLDLSNNHLQSPFPAFLRKTPSLSQVNLRNNSFVRFAHVTDHSGNLADLAVLQACPLPSWCAPPPSGDGSCAPCGMKKRGARRVRYDISVSDLVEETQIRSTAVTT